MKTNKVYLILLVWLFGILNIFSQVFPVNEINVTGERDKRINIVFLGEGFTIDQMNDFNRDAGEVAASLFQTEPYNTYQNYFNIYCIEVPSQESGSTHPGTANDEPGGFDIFSKNTYFNSTYDYGGTHRLLVIQNSSAAYSVLQANFPDWDIVFIIVNHEYYGGSGGTFATTSVNINSFEVAIHELGHSFSRLADEYDGSASPRGFEAPNATAATKFENIKWNKWILPTTPLPTPETQTYENVVGLFEGAVYSNTGWYRPKLNCKMKVLNTPFCEVCSEQTVLSIYNFLDVINEYQPLEAAQNIAVNESKEFLIKTIDESSKRFSLEWFWDNELVSENIKTFTIDAADVTEGIHKLKVVAKDKTEFVRNDPQNLLTSEFEWTINIGNTTSTDDEVLKYDYSLEQNYPNPFNPSTKIKYTLAKPGNASLKVYDIFGRELAKLIDSYKSAGNYEIDFNAGELASGVYFYVLTSGNFRSIKKLILLK